MRALSKTALMVCVAIIGCEGERSSVGELPCFGAHTRCRPVNAFFPIIADAATTLAAEGRAEIVWKHAFNSPPCSDDTCSQDWHRGFVVHQSGNTTVATLLGMKNARSVGCRLEHLDSNGEITDSAEHEIFALGEGRAVNVSLELSTDRAGRTLALVSVELANANDYSLVSVLELADEKRFEPRLMVSTSPMVARSIASVEADIVASSNDYPVTLARFRGDGTMVWRQSQVIADNTAIFGPPSLNGNTPRLLALAVDQEAHIWTVLSEAGYGIARMDGDGNTDRHGVVLNSSGSDLVAKALLAFDSRNRALAAIDDRGVLRVDPEGPEPDRYELVVNRRSQEEFYTPLVSALAIDDDDRVYVATQAGPRSARKVLIDRISEDFRARDTFVLIGLDQPELQDLRVTKILIGPDGDLYLGGASSSNPAFGFGTSAAPEWIARVHLSES